MSLILKSEKKIKIDACDLDGETALSVFARSAYVEVVKHLLANGARPERKDRSYGNTSLHFACQYAQADIVRALLSHDIQRGLCAIRNNLDMLPIDVARKFASAICELELRRVTK